MRSRHIPEENARARSRHGPAPLTFDLVERGCKEMRKARFSKIESSLPQSSLATILIAKSDFSYHRTIPAVPLPVVLCIRHNLSDPTIFDLMLSSSLTWPSLRNPSTSRGRSHIPKWQARQAALMVAHIRRYYRYVFYMSISFQRVAL
jgi:hypothetical protein